MWRNTSWLLQRQHCPGRQDLSKRTGKNSLRVDSGRPFFPLEEERRFFTSGQEPTPCYLKHFAKRQAEQAARKTQRGAQIYLNCLLQGALLSAVYRPFASLRHLNVPLTTKKRDDYSVVWYMRSLQVVAFHSTEGLGCCTPPAN